MSEKPNKLKQTHANYCKALLSLTNAQATPIQEDRDIGGIIKAFEIVYELSWKMLKAKLLNDGKETFGPRDVFVAAYTLGYIDDEDVWLKMIEDRNNTVHTYNQPFALQMIERIKNLYLRNFEMLKDRIQSSNHTDLAE